MNPFFSVCISSVNRERTIFKTLKSLTLQSFRDFEVIIVDCSSSDKTRDEIIRFFNSDVYKQSSFNYRYITENYHPVTVEDWNEPLKYATGNFIAILEGDDQYLPEHLNNAFITLNNNENIGLYFTGKRLKKGLIESNEAISHYYSLVEIPAPSELIFHRTSKVGEAYLFNTQDYNYAPEIDLYIRMSIDGFCTMFSGIEGVIRDKSLKSRAKWKYYHDHYYIINYYKEIINDDDTYRKNTKRITYRACQAYIYDGLFYKGKLQKELRKQLVKHNGWFNTYYNIFISLILISIRFLFRRLFK